MNILVIDHLRYVVEANHFVQLYTSPCAAVWGFGV